MEKKITGEKTKGGENQNFEEIIKKETKTIAYIIDYLCLKLGWDTTKVLNNAHFDNLRKLKFYGALDNFESTRIIGAVPLGFSKAVTRSFRERNLKAMNELKEIIGGKDFEAEKNELEKVFGSKEGFEKFLEQLQKGQIPLKRIAFK